MNPVEIMLLGAFICMGSTIALYVINVINLKDKLIPTSLLKQSCTKQCSLNDNFGFQFSFFCIRLL